MTLKVQILQSLTRLFIILVSPRMSLFSEKMFIFNRCITGLMSILIKKSWTVSNPATLNHENKTITVTMIIIKERAYFELTPDIAKRLARYVLRQRSRQLKIKEKMGYNYLFNLNIQLQVVTPFLVLGAVHKLCCLKIGKF